MHQTRIFAGTCVLSLALASAWATACSSGTESPDPTGTGGTATGGTPTGGAATGGKAMSTGGAATGGAATGGQATGGLIATGGTSSGGEAGGRTGSTGGNSNGPGGHAGGAGGGVTPPAGGAGGGSSVSLGLTTLRVDDPCAGKADTSDGAVCQHVTLTAAGGYKASQEVTLTGNAGTTYDVTLRVRGVVEPTSIDGGTRTGVDTGTITYKNMTFRKVPFTIGGTVKEPDYNQWHVAVSSPKQDYYLNDYQKVGHYNFKLDYEVTIPMAGNSKVTLDCTDRNEREIVNFEKYALDGIPGSMNFGQFVQVDVVSVKAR